MSRGTSKSLGLLAAAGFLCVGPTASLALIEVAKGNKPVKNLGWPTGTEAVANLPSRLGFTVGPPFGGGEYHFKYHCKDTAEFSRALDKFGTIRAPRTARQSLQSIGGQRSWIMDDKPLLLVVHDWPKGRSERGAVEDGKRVDWTFTVWVARNFHRLFSHPKGTYGSDHPNYRQPVPPPRIDVYVGGEGPIEWDEVRVPSNVRVIDQRRSAATASQDGGVVRGGVYDMATRQLIAGAEVTLSKRAESRQWQDVRQIVTDDLGAFEMSAIAEGYYRVCVRKEGYAARLVAVFHNQTGHASLDLDALLSRAASLKGTATDEEGYPLNGVEVRTRAILGIDGLGYQCADEPRAVTDEQGRFELAPLPEGFVAIRGRSPGMHQIRIQPDEDLLDVPAKRWPGRKDREVRIIMGGTGDVCGKVLGMDGLPPTRKFIVQLMPEGGHKIGSWGGTARCRKGGHFEFNGVPPGKYELTARPNPGRTRDASAPQKITVEAGKACQVEIRSAHAR